MFAEDFIEVVIADVNDSDNSDANIKVISNPFVDETVISIQDHVADKYHLRVFDVQGKLLREEVHYNNDIVLKKKGLVDGIYFYEITSDSGLFASGRLIVK